MKKGIAVLLASLSLVSLTAIAVNTRGGGGYGHDGGGEDGGYGPGGIYNTPYYAGNPNEDYANPNEPNPAGDVFDYAADAANEVMKI
jgi:hypothetical protein